MRKPEPDPFSNRYAEADAGKSGRICMKMRSEVGLHAFYSKAKKPFENQKCKTVDT